MGGLFKFEILDNKVEHQALMATNMMSNQMCSDLSLLTCKTDVVVMPTSAFKANRRLLLEAALTREASIEALTTTLILPVRNDQSQHV